MTTHVYPKSPFCDLRRWPDAPDSDVLRRWLVSYLPDGDFEHILVKPNWVHHEETQDFPISALVTSPTLIRAIVDACLTKYSSVTSVTVGDVPLQSCNWELLVRQAGIDGLIHHYAGVDQRVQFVDMRQEAFSRENGLLKLIDVPCGDPRGYCHADLQRDSFLDPISGDRLLFRVNDYDECKTIGRHREGQHRYTVCRTALEADLVINLPKMKTHQKAGITGALKNLVGIVGDKSCLVHHRAGLPAQGGDEFAPESHPLVRLQARTRELLSSRNRLLFAGARYVWTAMKRLCRIHTLGTREHLCGSTYVGSGSWYGNDTIWRMIYDLNRIILYAPKQGGGMRPEPQRAYLAIVDGLVAGEGNGPLQPLAVPIGLVGVANDPFLMDMSLAQLMGFDWRKIPQLNMAGSFGGERFAAFDANTVRIGMNGRVVNGIDALPILHRFLPPPGWRGHVELAL